MAMIPSIVATSVKMALDGVQSGLKLYVEYTEGGFACFLIRHFADEEVEHIEV